MTWKVVSFEQSGVDWEWRGLDAKAREVGSKSSGQEPLCFHEFALLAWDEAEGDFFKKNLTVIFFFFII